MTEIMSSEQFRANVIDRHRQAVTLFRDVLALLEVVLPRPIDIHAPFPRALHLFFIQAYKSLRSIYVLCVRGHGEDAVTILRRLLEIAFQVRYLAADEDCCDKRARQYLAYFWSQVPERLEEGSLPDEFKNTYMEMYEKHKHLLPEDSHNWWGGSIRGLAKIIGKLDTYDKDYKTMSQMAHATSQGFLLEFREGEIDIRSDRMVSENMVIGCRYMLGVAEEWHKHFELLDDAVLKHLLKCALNFDFEKARHE